MDSSSPSLAVRHTSSSSFTRLAPLTQDLLFTLLVLVIVCSCSVFVLFWIRRRRRAAKEAGLPLHYANDNNPTLSARRPHHRRTPSSLTTPVATSQSSFHSIFFRQEKQAPPPGKASPSAYPLPEIRIHFPEEVDDTGKHCSRVVTVRVGENGFGLEPVEEALPPPYQRDASDRFHSLDLERLGGLKEKEIVA